MTKKSGASLSGYIVSIILISVIMLVPGCGGGASQSGGGEPRVKHHVWGPLYASFTEHSGYAMYTYLLFKYEQTDSMEEGKEITDRYRVILDAITGTVDTLGDTSFYPPRETNVFYIPLMQSASGNAPLLERYNFSLSRKYITALSTYYKRKKDNLRTQILNSMGIRVMRFYNEDVENDLEKVLTEILMKFEMIDSK